MGEEEAPAVETAETTATESAPVEQPTESQPESGVPQETESNESESAGPPETVPYSRFKEVNDRRLELEKNQQQQKAQVAQSDFEEMPQLNNYLDQQLPVDPNTNEIDPVEYAKYVQQQAERQALQQVEMRLAWDKAEKAHSELADPAFRSAVQGMIYAESVKTGKVVTPSSAATALKKLLQGAQREAVQAEKVQSSIQDTVKPLVGGAQVNETRDPKADLRKVATQSQDLRERERARLEMLKSV